MPTESSTPLRRSTRAKTNTPAPEKAPPTPKTTRASSPKASPKVTASSSSSSSSKKPLIGGPPPGIVRRMFPMFPWILFPDILTVLRVFAIPILISSFYCNFFAMWERTCKYNHIVTSLIFNLASITDFFDGYLARRWEITSSFGAFLDPVADKLMVSTALVLLSGRYGAIMAVPSAVVLARELGVSALREWMASKSLRNVVKVGMMGKVKTAFQMIAIGLLLAVPFPMTGKTMMKNGLDCFTSPSYCLWAIGIVLLYVSSVLTVTSGMGYFQAAAPVLMAERKVGR